MTTSPNLVIAETLHRADADHLSPRNSNADNNTASNLNIRTRLVSRPAKSKRSSTEFRSSCSSMNSQVKMSTASMEDDDERFYDAIDAAESACLSSPNSNMSANKMKRFNFSLQIFSLLFFHSFNFF